LPKKLPKKSKNPTGSTIVSKSFFLPAFIDSAEIDVVKTKDSKTGMLKFLGSSCEGSPGTPRALDNPEETWNEMKEAYKKQEGK
jgi:hypothetical protein